MDDVLRTFSGAASAGDTFFFIYFSYAMFIQMDGTEFTAFYTFSAGDTAIGTAGAFCYMTSAVAGYKRYGNFFLTAMIRISFHKVFLKLEGCSGVLRHSDSKRL